MKIKDYKCKCGHDQFFFHDNGSQVGIYCEYCGKWYKWANKDELNLSLNRIERKKGRWIYHIDDLFPSESTQECSVCHEHERMTMLRHDTYCPNCGAEMKVEDNGRNDN